MRTEARFGEGQERWAYWANMGPWDGLDLSSAEAKRKERRHPSLGLTPMRREGAKRPEGDKTDLEVCGPAGGR